MKKLILTIFTFLMVVCFAQTGSASIIYDLTDNGSGNYTIDFEVVNDWGSGNVEWFSIYFGETTDGLNFSNWDQFTNLTPDWAGQVQVTDWDSYSFQPSSIDLPAQFNSDYWGFGVGIAGGTSLDGFSVTFDWNGEGVNSLFYEVGFFDPTTGEDGILDGFSERRDPGENPVPEPATVMLFGIGLLGIAAVSRKKRC